MRERRDNTVGQVREENGKEREKKDKRQYVYVHTGGMGTKYVTGKGNDNKRREADRYGIEKYGEERKERSKNSAV